MLLLLFKATETWIPGCGDKVIKTACNSSALHMVLSHQLCPLRHVNSRLFCCISCFAGLVWWSVGLALPQPALHALWQGPQGPEAADATPTGTITALTSPCKQRESNIALAKYSLHLLLQVSDWCVPLAAASAAAVAVDNVSAAAPLAAAPNAAVSTAGTAAPNAAG